MRSAVSTVGAPAGPGVYAFLGTDGELLYVGKAVDIRRRLRQHSSGRPASPRVAMLYEQIAEVRWERLVDEGAAAAREADLIVAMRPRFNASHRNEGRWNFIAIEPAGERMRFSLVREPAASGRSYGCFPHLGRGVSSPLAIACSDGYTALLRLLWLGSGSDASTYPARITRSAPDRFDVPVRQDLRPTLHAFLSGSSARLLDVLPGPGADQAAAAGFFRAGPRRLRELGGRKACPRAEIEALIAADFRKAIGDFRLPPPPLPEEAWMGRKARPWASA